jgi:hypothetical protein
MTPRERFLRTMNYEPVDRPLAIAFEPFESFTTDRWREQGLAPDQSPVEALGMDYLRLVPVHFGPLPALEHRVLEETDTHITETDWLGSTVRRRKDAPGMYYGHVDHAVKTRQDWEALKERFRPDTPGRLPADLDQLAADLETSDQPVGLHVFPFFMRLGFYLMGMERFLTAFYEEPDLMHDMFAFWGDFVLQTLRPLLGQVRLDFVTFAEDLAYTKAPHISPRVYEQFWLPYQDPIVEALHAAGVPLVVEWSAGNLEPLLPLMVEHGINCTWPLERQAGMDAYAVRARYGRDLRLGGAFPKQALIAGPEAVDREIAYLLPLMQEGGFVPAVDDMPPPEVPWATYRYYIEQMQGIRF